MSATAGFLPGFVSLFNGPYFRRGRMDWRRGSSGVSDEMVARALSFGGWHSVVPGMIRWGRRSCGRLTHVKGDG